MVKSFRIVSVVWTLVLLSVATICQAKEAAGLKPRLVVCTDIAPANVEPDDNESMVRLMAYADLFEIEALITTEGVGRVSFSCC